MVSNGEVLEQLAWNRSLMGSVGQIRRVSFFNPRSFYNDSFQSMKVCLKKRRSSYFESVLRQESGVRCVLLSLYPVPSSIVPRPVRSGTSSVSRVFQRKRNSRWQRRRTGFMSYLTRLARRGRIKQFPKRGESPNQ